MTKVGMKLVEDSLIKLSSDAFNLGASHLPALTEGLKGLPEIAKVAKVAAAYDQLFEAIRIIRSQNY